MIKFFYLKTCSTCQRIMKELNLDGAELREIKSNLITDFEIDKMKGLSGSYASLFSRRAMKYKSMGLAEKKLMELDYKQLILDEYTFLKRPVLIAENKIVIGNSKKAVEEMKNLLIR